MTTFRRNGLALCALALSVASGGALADADDDAAHSFSAKLSGFKEAPPVASDARGRFRATLHGDTLEYELTLRGFTTLVRFAHIHFGQRGVNGGVMVFLCDSTGGGPSGTPPCPQEPGSVSGHLSAGDVVGPEGQGIAAGDFERFIRALRANRGYVNVHSDRVPSGELRGDVRAHDD